MKSGRCCTTCCSAPSPCVPRRFSERRCSVLPQAESSRGPGPPPCACAFLAFVYRENIADGRPDASNDEIEVAARLAEAREFVVTMADGYRRLYAALWRSQTGEATRHELSRLAAVIDGRPATKATTPS